MVRRLLLGLAIDVMCSWFGLTNAATTFMDLMNRLSSLDLFVIVVMDILV